MTCLLLFSLFPVSLCMFVPPVSREEAGEEMWRVGELRERRDQERRKHWPQSNGLDKIPLWSGRHESGSELAAERRGVHSCRLLRSQGIMRAFRRVNWTGKPGNSGRKSAVLGILGDGGVAATEEGKNGGADVRARLTKSGKQPT